MLSKTSEFPDADALARPAIIVKKKLVAMFAVLQIQRKARVA